MDSRIPTTPAHDTGTPKKFIRTFAGDMETLQAGGVPDLAPFESKKVENKEEEPAIEDISSKTENLVPEAPAGSLPEPLPEYIRTFSGDVKTVQEGGTPDLIPFTKEEREVRPTPIKTYAGDFSQQMKDTNASTLTVLAAEQDEGKRFPEVEDKKELVQKNILYIFAGALLFIAGGIGVHDAYVRYAAATAPVIVAALPATPIFVDTQESIAGKGAALVSAIQESARKPLALNAVRLLSLSDATDKDTLFSMLNLHAPGVVTRNSGTEGSMVGIVNVSTGESPFLILSVDAYSSVFSGMLAWEPLIPTDFDGLFPPQAMNITATTTPVNAQATFHDETVSNHDVRVYRDQANKSVLLYGFWDQQTLVIARDPVAFGEIVRRLATSRSAK